MHEIRARADQGWKRLSRWNERLQDKISSYDWCPKHLGWLQFSLNSKCIQKTQLIYWHHSIRSQFFFLSSIQQPYAKDFSIFGSWRKKKHFVNGLTLKWIDRSSLPNHAGPFSNSWMWLPVFCTNSQPPWLISSHRCQSTSQCLHRMVYFVFPLPSYISALFYTFRNTVRGILYASVMKMCLWGHTLTCFFLSAKPVFRTKWVIISQAVFMAYKHAILSLLCWLPPDPFLLIDIQRR